MVLTAGAVASFFWFPDFEPYLKTRIDSAQEGPVDLAAYFFGFVWAVSKFAYDFPLLVLPVVLSLLGVMVVGVLIERPPHLSPDPDAR